MNLSTVQKVDMQDEEIIQYSIIVIKLDYFLSIVKNSLSGINDNRYQNRLHGLAVATYVAAQQMSIWADQS